MAFKISNETKVGALTAIAITLLILGFNFLKGKTVFKSGHYLNAKFATIDGLLPAHPVQMNGYTIGSVYTTTPTNKELDSIIVTIKLNADLNIPANSVATIKGNPLGTPSMVIVKGDANFFLKNDDTIRTIPPGGFLAGLTDKVDPTLAKINIALGTIDTVMRNFNSILDPTAKGNLQQVLANFNTASANLVQTTASLNGLLNAQTGSISKTMHNLQDFSQTLSDSKERISGTLQNLETTTANLSKMDLDKTVQQLNATIAQLQTAIKKLDNTDNTVGALLNDKKLYNNLTSTVNSLNLLMQDLRLNPKRYVNISVFGGKKGKGDPLMKPLAEDSLTQEQFKN